MLRVQVDRHRCVGAGNCIYLAPTAFRWREGSYTKADVLEPDTVEEDVLRAAAASCPTQAIILEEADDLAPWAGVLPQAPQ